MSAVTPRYALALLRVASPRDLLRAVAKRALVRPAPPLRPISCAERDRAARALARAPRLFTSEPLDTIYRARFSAVRARINRRAERILDGELEIFGRAVRSDAGARESSDGDPKWRWELARAGHLVELAAAARLDRSLGPRARRSLRAQIEQFLDENVAGEGFHYASPLEVAVRNLHWLAALELAGGAPAFPASFVARLAGGLASDGQFLATHLEEGGVAPANHLLGDLVGLYAIALAIGESAWLSRARAGIVREARRQVEHDGAHFEASTAYHRFALELLLVAHLLARAAGAPLPLDETLRRMFRFVRGILAPDGSEPGFGDSDDARLLPIVPRAPRDHSYLLPIGAALLGDRSLKPRRLELCEEVVWLFGERGARAFDRLPATPELASASFPSGGVHVLRAGDLYVALRSGPYGQRGVGGHAHNDQLALVVHARGGPLVIDPGTGGYTGDALRRDRFRGTAAHATCVVDGAEQSPLVEGRPFALPGLARAAPVLLEEHGDRARLIAAHDGYRRLPERVIHERQVILHRTLRLLVIEDRFTGRGEAAIEVRFPLAGEPRLGASAATLDRLRALAPLLGLGGLDGPPPEPVIEVGGRVALVLLGPPLSLSVGRAPWSPRYGEVRSRPLVAWAGRLTLPSTVRVAVLL